MSSSSNEFTDDSSQGKRIYSKKGCRECKRRKIKCDEGKPDCWQCRRLRKECSYPEVGEKVLRVSRKKLKQHEESHQYQFPQHQQQPQQLLSPVQPTGQEQGFQRVRDFVPATFMQGPVKDAPTQTGIQLYQSPSANIMVSNVGQSATVPHFRGPSPIPQNITQLGAASIPYPMTTPQYVPAMLSVSQPSSQPQPAHMQVPVTAVPPSIQPQYPPFSGHRHPRQPPVVPVSPAPLVPPYQVMMQRQQQQQSQHQHPSAQQHTIATSSNVLPRPIHTPISSEQISSTSEPTSQSQLEESQIKRLKTIGSGSILSLLNDTKLSRDNSVADVSSNTQKSTSQNGTSTGNGFTTPPESSIGSFDIHDLNLLANDLNNMVSELMFELKYNEDENNHKKNGTETEECISNTNASAVKQSHHVRHIPIDFIKFNNPTDTSYLEEFYNEFSNIILPFSSYDRETKCYFNPARDIILVSAANENYLLAAVLANGARSLFTRTKVQKHEEAYCIYLSKCLKLLAPALSADDKRLTSNIESVLLTVLLLTTTNASNLKQDWRPHLKGAKDLLLKNSMKKIKSSKVLIFCKCWFVTLEILAGISSQKGGTLQTDEDIDLLINSGDAHEQEVLKEIGIIVDKGFNIMGGYHNDCYDYFGDLIKILNKIRNNRNDFDPSDSFEYMRLFAKFQGLTELVFIKKQGLSKPQDFQKIPQGHLVDCITINEEQFVVSWMDVCHQSYVMACMITLLNECFKEDYTSPQVQLLTNTIVGYVSYLAKFDTTTGVPEQAIKCALMMLQWPMLVAGKSLIQNELKDTVQKFFYISGQIGSGGASIALKRVRNIWLKHENKITSEEDDSETEDLVSY
ncbi:uncharacterized protein J8A68_004493 [[Candida] subhashii]|uniref:Zn(2)-C6 fungal-type domain-containing protein n=1 Tax=[Candida] subhashii TaxID=561895 RepID=A0A8J5QH45_9ASCO|nr:uncharacterized protein J8A68_004493 [[Candida] subhashii]KAG7661993.1 hypothetical protein J8A68_004493 [[Candida] subhashii]